MKSHIVHIATSLSAGGAETMLYKLLSALRSGPFSFSVISLTNVGPVGKKIQALEIPVIALGMHRRCPNPWTLIKLAILMRALKPDLVQTWMYHADMIGGWAAKLAGGFPVIWGIHHTSLDSDCNKRSTILVVDICARLSRMLPNKIVCCAKAAERVHVLRGYHRQKMIFIPNGFDLNRFRPDKAARKEIRRELGLSEDSIIIGLVGRFHPLKDHYNFVQAATKLDQSNADVHFVLCGNGVTWDNSVLVSWIDKAGIRFRCRLLGARCDINKIYASLDVFTSSSCSEAFPLVVGEAMACGVPCVVTDVGDSAYIVGNTGIVVSPGDPSALARAWTKLLALPSEERMRLGSKARKRIADNFDLQSTAKKYKDLWLSVVTNRQI